MPKVDAAHTQSRIEQILRGAATVAARDGVDRSSLRDVAAESGLSLGAIYNYFPSKESLVLAAAEQRGRELSEIESQITEAQDPGRALIETLLAMLGSEEFVRGFGVDLELASMAGRNEGLGEIVRGSLHDQISLLARVTDGGGTAALAQVLGLGMLRVAGLDISEETLKESLEIVIGAHSEKDQ